MINLRYKFGVIIAFHALITGISREFCKTKIATILIFRGIAIWGVGRLGFEPGMTEPKPVVLPLHHRPIAQKAGAKLRKKVESGK